MREKTRSKAGKSNRRGFSRVATHLDAVLIAEERVICCGPVQDLSMNGVSLECADPPPGQTECFVVLHLGELEHPVEVRASGRVKRSTKTGVAVEFTELDLESFHHLRNLVLYNSTEITRTEMEMKEHLGLKGRT